MSRYSRQAGKRYEREIADTLRRLGFSVRRNLDQHGADKRDILGIPGLHLEVKGGRQVGPLRLMREAEEEAGDRVPVLLLRPFGTRKVYVMLNLEDILRARDCIESALS